MRRYRLSPKALRDLQSLHDYIAREGSAERADRMLDALVEAMDRLAEMPGMGRVRRTRRGAELRVWPVPPFLVFYRRAEASIEIVRVLHGARDADALL